MSWGGEAWALVAVGGAVGGALRHLTGVWSARAMRSAAHWGTWFVNCSGAGLLGLLLGVYANGEGLAAHWWLLLGVGLLGSYTTVSTLALQLLELHRAGLRRIAALYLLATLAGGLTALVLAYALVAR